MKCVIFAFSERGKLTGTRVLIELSKLGYETECYTPPRLAGDGYSGYNGTLPSFTGSVFDRDALVFIAATGIAIRAIAPHITSKTTDPAVISMDEAGKFTIALLSGHIGGANRLCRFLADALDALPVITTATDINGRFSVDEWATIHGLFIEDMALAKRISVTILTRDIPIISEKLSPESRLPGGLFFARSGDAGICISSRNEHPFKETLLLIPRVFEVGIGCRKGVSEDIIEKAVRSAFESYNLAFEAICEIASIDIKSNEQGLRDFCEHYGLPLRLYSAEDLSKVSGSFSGSDFVLKTTGVDNVCERAAVTSGGKLIVKKTAINGVTVAVAEHKWGIDFE